MRKYSITDRNREPVQKTEGVTLRVLVDITDLSAEDVDAIAALPVGGIVKLESKLIVERTA